MRQNITYNHLKLPYTISGTGGERGCSSLTKWLVAEVKRNVRPAVQQGAAMKSKHFERQPKCFCGNIERLSNGTYEYQYYIKDHTPRRTCLYNVRVVFKSGPTLISEHHYYAFGEQGCSSHTKWLVAEVKRSYRPATRCKIGRGANSGVKTLCATAKVLLREAQEDNFHTSGTNQKYRYNGKELYGASLGWYDYGARYYDACLGRFLGVDPLAEKYPSWTAYHYVHNNPLRYDDPTGMSANDKIDVNKQTGNITVTPAAGNDEVRLVNDGKVENSYIYGKNGSFCKENDIQSDKNGTSVTMSDENKAQKFYEFAAQSNVEFGKLDVEKNGAKISVVITSHDEKGVGTLPGLVETFSVAGYTGIKQSHSHPDGQSVPSGHYDDNDPKNPYSLNPVPKGHKDYKTGDAQNARWTQSKSGFKNTKFEVYNPKTGSKTTYDGISKAKIHRK